MDFLFILAIAPVAFLLWYIYKKDSHKEPAWELVKPFLFGFVAVIPIIIVELIAGIFFRIETSTSYVSLFINVFLSIGIVEEFFKWLVVKISNYNNKHFDESYDAIVYCVYSSLGFATFENILYVFQNGNIFAGAITGFVRIFSSIPAHAMFGLIMGVFMAKAKSAQISGNKGAEKKYLALSLVIASIAHTLYDFFLFANNSIYMIIWFILMVVAYIFSIKLINKESTNNVIFHQRNIDMLPTNYYPQYNTPITDYVNQRYSQNNINNNNRNGDHWSP